MSSLGTVPHLAQFVVKPQDLRHPEYCFDVIVDFAKKLRDDPGVTFLKQILTGLLNTSGGRIDIRSHDSQPPDDERLDRWKQELEDTLVTFIPFDVCRTCIHLLDYAYPMTMIVYKSHKLVTMNSHMFVRWLAGNKAIHDGDTINSILTQSSAAQIPDPFHGKADIAYRTRLPFVEGPNIEFKHWKSVKVFEDILSPENTYQSRLKDQRTRKTLFSLPNMTNGGYLIIGVKEDRKSKSNVVLGQIISEQDEKKFTEYIKNFVLEDDRKTPRIWGDASKSPIFGIDWTIRIIPITGGPSNERRRVIVVGFNHFQGGVWEQCPESFYVSEDGHIHQISFDDWSKALWRIGHMTRSHTEAAVSCSAQTEITGSLISTTTTQGATSEETASKPMKNITKTSGCLMTCIARKITSSKQCKMCKSTRRGTSMKRTYTPVFRIDDTLLGRTYLSWTEHKLNWDSNISESKLDIETNATKLANQCPLLKMSSPIALFPNRVTIAASQPNKSKELDIAIDCIEKSIPKDRKSFGIASTNWTNYLPIASELKRPGHHMFDVFVFDEAGDIDLWTVVDEQSVDLSYTWEYVLLSGRTTKRCMLYDASNIHADSVVPNVQITCHVYQLGQGDLQRNSIQQNQISPPSPLEVDTATLKTLNVYLAKTLLKKETLVKTIFGDTNSIILTAEQMDTILQIGLNKFNFIEGPPGSGKTYLALHLCQTHNCAYIYSKITFGNFLDFQKVRHKFLAENSDQLMQHIQRNAFRMFEYIIVDDVQSFDFPSHIWLDLFLYISQLDFAVKLVIFGDSFYQNYMGSGIRETHKSRTYLLEFCRQRNFQPVVRSLSTVHRNNRKIVSFIKSNFEGDPEYPEHSQISCTHTEDGDDVEVRSLPDIMSTEGKNSLVEFICELTDPRKLLDHDRSGYEPKDVAILIDTVDAAVDAIRLQGIFRDMLGGQTHVHDAGTFPVVGYTLDKLDNFIGFDRKVCVLVTSDNVLQSNKRDGRSIANPRYRTFVASRGISKVVFVVGLSLSSAMASSFNLGTMSSEIRRIWHQEKGCGFHDLCFVDHDGEPAIIGIMKYSNNDNTLHMISVAGKQIALSMEGKPAKNYHLISSSSDGQKVVLAGEVLHQNVAECWTWAVYNVKSGQMHEIHASTVRSRPTAICWISNNDIILSNGDGIPVRYSSVNGEELMHYSGCSDMSLATTNPHTNLVYFLGPEQVHEVSSDGDTKRTISTGDLKCITTLCVDSKDLAVFLGCGYSCKTISMLKTSGGRPQKVTEATDGIHALKLHGDRYLAVATYSDGIQLYDISCLLL